MNIQLKKLVLKLKKSVEEIEFSDVSYFHGQMGAGKTSIAHLIDYCFGGKFEYTPALQQEFVSVTLELTVGRNNVFLTRPRDSNKLIVSYSRGEEALRLIVSIDPDEEVIPNTGVKCLSDLMFYLAEIKPPRVRRSKIKEDSDLLRLSFKNLLWYCYLDQDEIDSDFFHLGASANIWKRLASRDVLRFIIGFHQEKVSELEESLAELRDKRRSLKVAANTLKETLQASSIETYDEIHLQIQSLTLKEKELSESLGVLKEGVKKVNNKHAADKIKDEARYIFFEIENLDNAVQDVKSVIKRDKRHLNEIEMLKLKVRRDEAARTALMGVAYSSCPSCLRDLPNRDPEFCFVCGREEIDPDVSLLEVDILEKDADIRVKELSSTIKNHQEQLKHLEKNKKTYINRKAQLDARLTEVLSEYDSAYLSTVIETEKNLTSIRERVRGLEKLQELPAKANQLLMDANDISPKITELNNELKTVREQAEKNTKNLKELEELFLNKLLESSFPGIKREDSVSITSPEFLPEVNDANIGDLAVTSFSNLSSGGKKTIFKSCFSLAIHCLARATHNAILPTLLIIDSPMKNISERENKEVFESFMKLIYSLAESTLKGTQIVIIDKEYFPPPEDYKVPNRNRHMQPNSTEYPPLIPYYQGH